MGSENITKTKNNKLSEVSKKNLKKFLNDCKPLLELKTFGEWKSDVIRENEDGTTVRQFPFVIYRDEVSDFTRSFLKNDIIVREGEFSRSRIEMMLKEERTDYSLLSMYELRLMITSIIRDEGLCEGITLIYLEEGKIQKILIAMEKKLDEI